MLKQTINAILQSLYAQPAPSNAAAQLAALKKRYHQCMQCPLASQGRSQVVFGVGPATASLMIIGEAPGKDEDAQGAPFVGRSGRLLTTLLNEAGIDRGAVYISNIAKCRPPANRPPTPTESATCSQLLLLQEINIIRPLVICTLGATATQTFIESSISISELRGEIIQTPYFALLPTYHPSYVLRNRKAGALVVADLVKIDKSRN